MNLAADDFTLFNLPQQYALDLADLQARWKAALSAAHPDRFAQAGAAGQRLAMQWSVRLNEAYQRLKNPLKRAEYLCVLRGAAIDAERNTAMPPAFLMQQMEWREALDEATTAAAKTVIRQQLQAQAEQYQHDIYAALDIQNDATLAANTVRAWMFVDKFIKQI
jgi:molecular chaperone HscB